MFVYDVNILLESQGANFLLPDQAARAVFHLKEHLKTAGWIHQASGDGLAAFSTTPGNVNDVITQEGIGAGGMANPLAWVVMQHPASSRQMLFQKDSAEGNEISAWRVMYSFSAGFTGGTPSPTQTPSAADHRPVLGGGEPDSPIFANWFAQADQGISGCWCHIVADNAAPYGWWLGVYPLNAASGSPIPQATAVFDPIVDGQPGDTDPYVLYCSQQNGTPWREGPVTNDLSFGYFDKGGPNETWTSLLMSAYPSIQADSVTSSFADGSITRLPVFYIGDVFGRIYKGRSTLLHMIGQEYTNGQPLQVVTPRAEIVIGWFSAPWDGTTPKV